MNSTPAPPSTALAASNIWSGVGEVKTSPGTGRAQHPRPDEPAVHRLMAGPATRYEPDLAGHGGVDADDELRVVHDTEHVPVCELHTFKRLADDRVGVVDELLHAALQSNAGLPSGPETMG